MSSVPFDLARIGAGLPVAGVLGELRAALAGGVAVVQAPPGTGKTTLVPPLAADLLLERAAGSAAPACSCHRDREARRAFG